MPNSFFPSNSGTIELILGCLSDETRINCLEFLASFSVGHMPPVFTSDINTSTVTSDLALWKLLWLTQEFKQLRVSLLNNSISSQPSSCYSFYNKKRDTSLWAIRVNSGIRLISFGIFLAALDPFLIIVIVLLENLEPACTGAADWSISGEYRACELWRAGLVREESSLS